MKANNRRHELGFRPFGQADLEAQRQQVEFERERLMEHYRVFYEGVTRVLDQNDIGWRLRMAAAGEATSAVQHIQWAFEAITELKKEALQSQRALIESDKTMRAFHRYFNGIELEGDEDTVFKALNKAPPWHPWRTFKRMMLVWFGGAAP